MARDGAVSRTISVWSSDEFAYVNLRIEAALGRFQVKSNRFRVGPTVFGLVASHTISVWLSDEIALKLNRFRVGCRSYTRQGCPLKTPTISGLVCRSDQQVAHDRARFFFFVV